MVRPSYRVARRRLMARPGTGGRSACAFAPASRPRGPSPLRTARRPYLYASPARIRLREDGLSG